MSSKSTTTKSKAGVWEGEEDELAVLIYKSSKTAKLRASAAAAEEEQMHASAGRRTSKESTVSCESSTRTRKPSSTEVKGEAQKKLAEMESAERFALQKDVQT